MTTLSECTALQSVQDFGGAVNPNVHLHVLSPDAVFIPGQSEDDELRLVPLAVPEDKDVRRILEKVVRRVSVLVRKRCGLDDDLGLEPEHDVLDGAIDEAMRKVPVPQLPWAASSADDELLDETSADALVPARTAKRCFRLQGFSLHANTAVAADNRLGLEKLCRYGMRPPFSHERLSLTDAGLVRLELRKPWPTANGVSSLTFEPVEFLRRLAALIPPPFAHLIRYHGLFAPRARHRDLLPAAPVTDIRLAALARAGALDQPRGNAASPPAGPSAMPSEEPAAAGAPGTGGGAGPRLDRPAAPLPSPLPPPATTSAEAGRETGGKVGIASLERRSKAGRQRLPWRELLRRVFSLDALLCPRCLGPMSVIAYITEAVVVTKIMMYLGLPSEPPTLSSARGPAQLDLFDQGWGSAVPLGPQARRSRAPPSLEAGFVVELDDLSEPDDCGA